MSGRDAEDARLAAARYGVDRDAGRPEQEDPSDRGTPTADQRSQAVEIAIQQAMRRGDFADLPGAGQPLPDLGAVRDPDWWIRRKIEREGLTGLGPPALTLRTEAAALQDRLDALGGEVSVREVLEDFNVRVREARRQLLGGPPVVTRPRDVDAEVAAWRERAQVRRAARQREAEEQRQREAAERAGTRWWQRRRAGRGR